MLHILLMMLMSITDATYTNYLNNETSTPISSSMKCIDSLTYYWLVIMAIFPLSAFFSVTLTSLVYRRNFFNYQKEPNYDEEVEEEEEETEEDKYIKMYSIDRATHDPPKNLEELKYNIIIEGTPRGILIMSYDIDFEGFNYWCDSDIPLTMLETAARRYVTEYNCRKFYLLRIKKQNEQPNTNKQANANKQPIDDEPEEIKSNDSVPDSVFIKRKKTATQLLLEKQIAEEEPVTRFIKKGRLLDFKPKELFKGMNFDEQLVKKTLNYNAFKRAMTTIIENEETPLA